MAFYADPTLRALLTEEARSRVTKMHRDKGYVTHQIGYTNIHLDKGLLFGEIAWGIDGLDNLISPEIAQYVDSYTLTQSQMNQRATGIYVLYSGGRKKEVLARARTTDYAGKYSEIIVSGKERKDVVKLYELVRDGKVVPDVELTEFKQIEGGLRELNRLRRRLPELEQQVATRDSRLKVQSEQLRSVREQLAKVQATAAVVK